MELDRPFLQLPFLFDTEVLTAEVDRLVPENWLAHPSGLSGNTAVPLVSINGEPRDGFDGPMAATAVLRRSPYILQVVSSFGEVVARSRLMRLAPGAEVQEHVDFNYHWYSRVRIHVPIVTEPTVRFFCGAEEVHMAAGEAWLFDSWRRHRVVNGSAKDRIHLVVDIAGSARFWSMVRRVQRAARSALAAEQPVALRQRPLLDKLFRSRGEPGAHVGAAANELVLANGFVAAAPTAASNAGQDFGSHTLDVVQDFLS